jgi:ATP-dependent helicase/nuclease subunit A
MEGSLNPVCLPDAEARLSAQTVFDRPVVLEAGAGTGKTAALVARIVAWSVGPGWERARADLKGSDIDAEKIAAAVLDGIVAITFTDDAAAEMTRRVAQALDDLQGDERLVGDHDFPEGTQVITGLDREALLNDLGVIPARAAALLTVMERLRTSTIHAFARSLVARFPVEAGLHPAFEVDADGRAVQECVEGAVEEVLGGAYRGEAFESEAMLLAANAIGPAEIRNAVIALVGDGAPPEALADDPMAPERLGPVVREWFADLDAVVPVAEQLAKVTGSSRTVATAIWLLDLAGLERNIGKGEGAAESLAGMARWIREQPEWDKNVGKLNAWGIGFKFGKREQVIFEAVSETQFDAVSKLARMMDFVLSFDPEVFGALRRILHEVLARVETEKRRKGIVAFQDLLVGARRLLEDNPVVLRSLRAEITQLLVDEMQDTDGEQARIVELLGLADEQGEGPGLFLVGDPKQSIYGWRNADMEIYRQLVRTVQERGGVVGSLTANFRSVQEVLDEVGRLVEPVMHEEEGIQPAFEPLVAAGGAQDEALGPEGMRTAVEHWVSTAAGADGVGMKTSAPAAAELEAEAVARDAAALWSTGTPLGEMAILMRSRGRQAVFLEALRRHGVPYVVGKDPNYYRTREVIEVMALVRLILDPFDALALVTVLRSPIVGVPDAALRPLWKAGLPGSTIGLGIEDHSDDLRGLVETAAREVEGLDLGGIDLEPLSGWSDALGGFLSKLAVLRRSFEEDLPDVFLERLRHMLALEPLAACRFPGAYRLANLDRFFRDLEEVLADGGTADAVVRHLRRAEREKPDETSGRPRSDAEGVRVMTIHGAKGLGFEHVWLIQTHARSNSNRSSAETVVKKVDGLWEMNLRGLRTPGFLGVTQRRTRMEEAEQIRLLYVALTRAKKRLVTLGNWMPTSGSGPMLKIFQNRAGGWPVFEDVWPDATHEAHVERLDARWVWLGHPRLDAGAPEINSREAGRTAVAPARIEADAEQLDHWRSKAIEHQGRPWLATASDAGHRLFLEETADRLDGAENEAETPHVAGVGQRIAMAVGTAMHALLEHFDHETTDPDEELDSRLEEALVLLTAALPPEDLSKTADGRLRMLIRTFRHGPLWQSFLALEGSIVARELELVTTPRDGITVGAVTGTIDLVYRDPQTGEIVVADYKTDHLENDQELHNRAATYRPQLEVYAGALQEALKLEVTPRRELWFLERGVITAWRSD